MFAGIKNLTTAALVAYVIGISVVVEVLLMGIVSQEDAVQLLKPLHRLLADMHWSAWNRWEKDIAPRIPAWSARGKRMVMNELVVDEARTRLANLLGVEIRETPSNRFLVDYE